jgi:hypothetical protein
MLPDLGRLRLRRGAPTGADGDEADLAAHEPPLSGFAPSPAPAQKAKRRRRGEEAANSSATASMPPAVLAEEDDPSTDPGYAHIQKTVAKSATTRELIDSLDQNWPVGHAHYIQRDQYRAAFDDMLTFDEPPHRHIFSSLGQAAPIRHLRLGSDSLLAVPGTSATPELNAFAALLALRMEFANKPVEYGSKQGCGQGNCYRGGVNPHGHEEWQVALRAIMLAVDKGRNYWQGGAALPKTVAVRAPKATSNRVDVYDWNLGNDARDELGLTLRAAQMGITPPVYATFPVKVVSETRGTLSKRDYGYIVEDGWMDLWSLLHALPRIHTTADDYKRAQYYVAKSISLLLHKVANVAEFLLMDVKTPNMVARRVGDTLKYEVLMIDFGALHAADANLDSDVQHTKPECVFFVNAVLLLNMVIKYHSDSVPIFYNLAMEVVNTWKGMQLGEDSFCAMLAADAARVQAKDIPDFGKNLLQLEGRTAFQERLRYNFYLTLDKYGDRQGLLAEADNFALGGGGFINRYVQLLEKKFQAVGI